MYILPTPTHLEVVALGDSSDISPDQHLNYASDGFSKFSVHFLLGGPRQSPAAGVFGGSSLQEGVGEGNPAGRRHLPPGEVGAPAARSTSSE